MRVFITGATGLIGNALVQALVKAGHQVTGLARSEEKEAQLRKLGASAVRGELAKPDAWKSAASQHEALVHAAIDYTADTPGLDRTALDALLDAARAGTVTSLVYTSGCWVLGNCPDGAGEDAKLNPWMGVAWRPAHEQLALQATTATLKTAVIRPGLVYGGSGGLTAFYKTALTDGHVAFIGDGKNHWPMIHRDDLAQLYRLVLEQRATGVFHAADAAKLTSADVAKAASEVAGGHGKTLSVPVEEARKKMGPVADALCLDQVLLTPRSTALGWKPARPSYAAAATEAFAEWKATQKP